MENFLTFLKLLIFSKTVLITPNAIDIEKEYTILLNKPISAITKGASLQIDVSGMLSKHKDIDVISSRYIVKKEIEVENIKIYLYSNKLDEAILLKYQGISWGGKNNIRIIFGDVENIKTDISFQKIKIETVQPLKKIKIYWVNGKH